MGFWSKLGKIGLAAAPYVAAPFTGGASLMATGATNKALSAWNQHDAQKNAAKGLAPSNFDRILGGASEGAGMASDMGAFSKTGPHAPTGVFSKGGQTPSNVMGSINTAMGRIPQMQSQPQMQPQMQGGGDMQGGLGPSAIPRPGMMPSDNEPYRSKFGRNFGPDQNNPNLANSINQGKMDARRSGGMMQRLQRQYA